jgi:hypothetical protein
MKNLLGVLLVSLAILAGAVGADAQTHVIASGIADGETALDVDFESGRVNWEMPDPRNGFLVGPDAVVTADGRFVIWTARVGFLGTESWLVRRDLLTGEIVRTRLPQRISFLVSHPRRFALFATVEASGLVIIDETGLRQVRVCSYPGRLAITANGDRVFVGCSDGVAVVDTASGVAIGWIPTPREVVGIAVDQHGERVVVIGRGAVDPLVALYDTQTGERLAAVPSPIDPCCGVAQMRNVSTNADRSKVYVSYTMHRGRLRTPETHVYDLRTLNLQAILPLELGDIVFTPDGRFAVALTSPAFVGCQALLIDAVADAVVRLVTTWARCGNSRVVLSARPLEPADVETTTSNRNVSVQWRLRPASPMAITYVVDVRLQPHGPVVASFETSRPSLDVQDAPPGVYYLRVRAVNALGSSNPSAELRVVVP